MAEQPCYRRVTGARMNGTQVNEVVFDGALEPAGRRIGVVALATDLTIERDLRLMLPPRVEIFTNRVHNANPLTLANLRAMRGDIARAAAGLLPGVGVDAVIYGCTSGAAAIGHQSLVQEIQKAHPQAPVTTPLAALSAACAALQVKRLSFFTPYTAAINRALAVQQTAVGLEVVNIDGLGFDDDTEVAGIAAADICRLAVRACRPQAQALFISCTALRASAVIAEIEYAIGRPVITSNQALAWHAVRLLGGGAPVAGFGRLLADIY